MIFDPYFFVAEKPSSENLYRLNFDNYTRFRSIPNSVVWFLKVSQKKSQFVGRKSQLESSRDSVMHAAVWQLSLAVSSRF